MENNYTKKKKSMSDNKENPIGQQSKKPILDNQTTLITKHITWDNK